LAKKTYRSPPRIVKETIHCIKYCTLVYQIFRKLLVIERLFLDGFLKYGVGCLKNSVGTLFALDILGSQVKGDCWCESL